MVVENLTFQESFAAVFTLKLTQIRFEMLN